MTALNAFAVTDTAAQSEFDTLEDTVDSLADIRAFADNWTSEIAATLTPVHGKTRTAYNGVSYLLSDDAAFDQGVVTDTTQRDAIPDPEYGMYVSVTSDNDEYHYYDGSAWVDSGSTTTPVLLGRITDTPGTNRSWVSGDIWPAYLKGGWNSDRTANLDYFGIQYNNSNTEYSQGFKLAALIDSVPTNDQQHILEIKGWINTHLQHTFPAGINDQRLGVIGKGQRTTGFVIRPRQGLDMLGMPDGHSGISIGHYSGHLVDTDGAGQYDDDVLRGGIYKDFGVECMSGANSNYGLWIGPVSDVELNGLWVNNAVEYQMVFCQTQDVHPKNLDFSGNGRGAGILFDWGCNGIDVVSYFGRNLIGDWVKFGARLGSGPTSVTGSAPTKMRMGFGALDIGDDGTTSAFCVEGAKAVDISHSRIHLNNTIGLSAAVPMIRVIDPPDDAYHSNATNAVVRFSNMTFRHQPDGASGSDGDRYFLQNDSGQPVAVRHSVFEGWEDAAAKGALTRGTNTRSMSEGNRFETNQSLESDLRFYDTGNTEIINEKPPTWSTDVQVYPSRTDLELTRSAGFTWFYDNGVMSQHSHAAQAATSITPLQIDGTTGTSDTDMAITQWEDSGSLVSTTSSKYYVSRIYMDPEAGTVYAMYAQREYDSMDDAAHSHMELDVSAPTLPTGVSALVLMGYVAWQQGVAHYNTNAEARHFARIS